VAAKCSKGLKLIKFVDTVYDLIGYRSAYCPTTQLRTIYKRDEQVEDSSVFGTFDTFQVDRAGLNPALVNWKSRTIIPQLPKIFLSSISILTIQENDSFSLVSVVDGQAPCVEEAG
jgi:hypothetical protein